MTDPALWQQLDASTRAAIKAARPHVMKAWAAAVALGHTGGFDAWVWMVFSDLADEAGEVAAGIPPAERAHLLHSPWHRG